MVRGGRICADLCAAAPRAPSCEAGSRGSGSRARTEAPKIDSVSSTARRFWRQGSCDGIRTSKCTRGVGEPMAGADSEPEAQPHRPEPVPGLTNARAQSLDRTPIRTRGSGVTLSGWRLSAVSDQGEGTIVVVDSESGENWY